MLWVGRGDKLERECRMDQVTNKQTNEADENNDWRTQYPLTTGDI